MNIAVMALLGTGKSTLVENLAEHNSFVPFREPVAENPFLELYYKDPNRWSYTMQTYLLWERYKQSQEAFFRSLRGDNVVLDSTIYSDFAFALVQKQNNYFSDAEFETYKNMYNIVSAQTAYPDVCLWLELTPKQTLERIHNRARDCEANIPIDYLSDLYDAYQIVLSDLEAHTKVIRIDARPSAMAVYRIVENVLKLS